MTFTSTLLCKTRYTFFSTDKQQWLVWQKCCLYLNVDFDDGFDFILLGEKLESPPGSLELQLLPISIEHQIIRWRYNHDPLSGWLLHTQTHPHTQRDLHTAASTSIHICDDHLWRN